MLHLALLGDPVAHSFSPRLHAAALAAAGIRGSYEARRVDVAGMESAVEEIRTGHLHGANVTMPHKRVAARLADSLEADAARAGSVNTLLIRAGVVAGASTDVEGIRRAWGRLPEGPVLILGAGGAAAAALLALEGRPLSVSARRPDAARALVARSGVEATVSEWGKPVDGAVVVNATALGMQGERLPESLLASAAGLFDMPYGKGQTPAVVTAVAHGLPVVDGVEMLISQAALSFELWTGVSPSPAAMRAAIEDDHSPESKL
ncbi:MAG: shikimate dehydrogenase [Acidimicrobiia bacterium]|nr:shikimate dehydrogenase [Acidimicrobiia bacterium]